MLWQKVSFYHLLASRSLIMSMLMIIHMVYGLTL
uniref:Uncharacterized protein n=1 Tax=Arundo donax TaxID=35708 RepID=A0A0A9F5B6_ARUDO